MPRPRGKSRKLSALEVCEQIERFVHSKGIEFSEFALAFQKFVPIYARLLSAIEQMHGKRKHVPRGGGIRNMCARTWRYVENNCFSPVEFADVLLEYAQIKSEYHNVKHRLYEFRRRYAAQKNNC